MKRLLTLPALASVSLFLFTACDWESGGSSNSYNSRFDWANFSGVYRPVSGRYVVTDFSGGQPESPGTESQIFEERADEQIATGNGRNTAFSGIARNRNIVPGSFTVSTVGANLRDDGNGILTGSGASGTIDYASGGWSVNFGGFAPDNGAEIRASYTYNVITNAVPGSPAQEPGSGTSGFQLFQFTVAQSGQRLILTDNTGREYTGDIGSIRGTRGDSRDTPFDVADPQTGDTVIATFNVEGISPANVKVKIPGTLQAIVAANGVLTNRSMQGTWIENNGRTGSVNAQAAPIRITMPNTPGGEG
jgi:hypothetical protein